MRSENLNKWKADNTKCFTVDFEKLEEEFSKIADLKYRRIHGFIRLGQHFSVSHSMRSL